MMEASSPVVVLRFSITNPLCNKSMEFNGRKLTTEAASLSTDPVASDLLKCEEAEVVALEQVGDGDDLEVQAIPASDEEESVSVVVETKVGSSADAAVSTCAGVENIARSAVGESGVSLAAAGTADSDTKAPLLISPAIRSSQAAGGSSGRNVLLTTYIPLWGCLSICGKRPEMEDAFAALPWFWEIPRQMLTVDHLVDGMNPSQSPLPAHFFGVYDGHGGAQVANYCRDRVHLALIEEVRNVNQGFGGSGVDDWHKQWETAFLKCFQKVDDEVGGKASGSAVRSTTDASEEGSLCTAVPAEPIAPETVGSTAVVAVICSSHIIIANCGDSRAVLCRGKEPVPLSVDHKPNREDEYARIEAAGGKVIQWNGYRVFGVLAMSRSIGDRYLKPWIIPEPEVRIIPRVREDECLILASDGLWDVLSNEEVCDIARKRILLWHKKNGVTSSSIHWGEVADPAAQAAADYLVRLALQKGSKDNITIIVIDLKAQRKFKSKTCQS